MNERISQAQEEVREFANEFEIFASDKSERFRELRSRDAHIDAFLDSFDEAKLKVDQHIKHLSIQVVKTLRLISANCRYTELAANVAAIDESIFYVKNEKAAELLNPAELQDCNFIIYNKIFTPITF